MVSLVLDTGALIGLERRHARIVDIMRRATALEHSLIVPSPVVAEWWRGRSDVRENILETVDVEPLDAALAQTAGEAMAAVKGSTVVDAIVMASAARRGAVVYTSDIDDLMRLQAFFPNTRVLRV